MNASFETTPFRSRSIMRTDIPASLPAVSRDPFADREGRGRNPSRPQTTLRPVALRVSEGVPPIQFRHLPLEDGGIPL
jgi:hypothetical protein